jgi:hypothetical protein
MAESIDINTSGGGSNLGYYKKLAIFENSKKENAKKLYDKPYSEMLEAEKFEHSIKLTGVLKAIEIIGDICVDLNYGSKFTKSNLDESIESTKENILKSLKFANNTGNHQDRIDYLKIFIDSYKKQKLPLEQELPEGQEIFEKSILNTLEDYAQALRNRISQSNAAEQQNFDIKSKYLVEKSSKKLSNDYKQIPETTATQNYQVRNLANRVKGKGDNLSY